MKTILREETLGVSEVLGTILILGMTVTLFSTVILWVSSFPTPQVQTRSDISSSMQPIYGAGGLVVGVNITLTHLGGEALQPASTVFYITDQPSSGPASTDVATLHRFNAFLAVPSGLIDGSDSVWSTGERWLYLNQAFRPSDAITITIVDNSRSLVVWSGPMNPAAGTRPPVFMNVWASGSPAGGGPSAVYAGSGFYLYADVVAPDNNLNPNSVYATITAWYGSPIVGCQGPLKMHDDAAFPDLVAGDGIFTLGAVGCTSPPSPLLSWAGSVILLNATDLKGHQTQTRFVLNVLPQGTGGGGAGTTIPNQVWQYIGFVQIRTGEVWVSNLSQPYTTTATFQPFRVSVSQLNTNGGALFHFKMANHGNTTVFLDGWTEAFFQNTQSASGVVMYVVAPCSTTLAANAGGVAAYPGAATINNFSYAHPGVPSGCNSGVAPAVFDINPADQQTGGTPYTVLVYPKTSFSLGTPTTWKGGGITYFVSILVSGMAGPNNYTYAQLTGKDPYNPYGCGGLNANYNPISHLNDPISACRTSWYAQVIPFIGMVVF